MTTREKYRRLRRAMWFQLCALGIETVCLGGAMMAGAGAVVGLMLLSFILFSTVAFVRAWWISEQAFDDFIRESWHRGQEILRK